MRLRLLGLAATFEELAMRFGKLVLAVACVGVVSCGGNVVGTSQDAGTITTDPNAYPAGPYGVSVNRTIQNFTLPGYFTAVEGTKVNDLEYSESLDLQKVRTTLNSDGQPFRYLLLDISAGWCPPCNQEAEDLGLDGSKSGKIAEWASKGGLFMTVLAEGYDESSHDAPVKDDIEKWTNQHSAQSTMVFDPTQALEQAGIMPSAFPTNLVIDLKTMKIVSAWYGLDATYQKWEAALDSQQ